MLTEIMNIFRQEKQPLDLNELSRRLETDRSALEGMLETLVRQGRLREVTPGSEECMHCSGRSSCLHVSGEHLGKMYELPEQPQ